MLSDIERDIDQKVNSVLIQGKDVRLHKKPKGSGFSVRKN